MSAADIAAMFTIPSSASWLPRARQCSYSRLPSAFLYSSSWLPSAPLSSSSWPSSASLCFVLAFSSDPLTAYDTSLFLTHSSASWLLSATLRLSSWPLSAQLCTPWWLSSALPCSSSWLFPVSFSLSCIPSVLIQYQLLTLHCSLNAHQFLAPLSFPFLVFIASISFPLCRSWHLLICGCFSICCHLGCLGLPRSRWCNLSLRLLNTIIGLVDLSTNFWAAKEPLSFSRC